MAAKILVVDGDPAAQRLAAHALNQDGHLVAVVHDVAAAPAAIATEHPDVVILDAAAAPASAFAALRKLRARKRPNRYIPVIVLTPAGHLEARVEALRAGADETLDKPFHPADVVGVVRSTLIRFPALDAGRTGSRGRIAAFYGAKGGVGTTTIAVNAAVALRRLDRRVALVDGNLQYGDARVLMDLGNDHKTIVDVVASPVIDLDLVASALVRDDSGVDVLLAPLTPAAAELVSDRHLPEILLALRAAYQFVLVDIGHRLDDINLRVMDAAETIFVVMSADLPTLKNTRVFLETIESLGFAKEKVRLLLNRANALTGIRAASMERALERSIDYQIVNDYGPAMSAVNSGRPVMVSKPGSRLGKSISAFASAFDAEPPASVALSQILSPTESLVDPARERAARRSRR